MSFTDSIKAELYQAPPRASCCRRSQIYGMLAVNGTAQGEQVWLTVGGDALLQYASHLVQEQFGREGHVAVRPGTIAVSSLVFTSATASAWIRGLADTPRPELPVKRRCDHCRRAFLQGIFLAAGRMTDPHKAYQLEFSCGERTALVQELLQEYGITPKRGIRRKEQLLYLRDSTAIEDLLAHLGAMQATFSVMDSKIERGMRNEANRVANCEANNIDKAISASMRQIEVIRRLKEENKFSFLPPELAAAAEARWQHTDLPLGKLAQIMDPPLTKSGLNHRLLRMMAMAENLLEEE